MKYTRQRCYVAPTTRWTGAFSPSCATRRPRLVSRFRKSAQKGLGFRRADAKPNDLAPSFGVGGHSGYRGDRDDASPLAHLEVGRIEPQIGPVALERPVEEGLPTLCR